jgi:hypothetical protein
MFGLMRNRADGAGDGTLESVSASRASCWSASGRSRSR